MAADAQEIAAAADADGAAPRALIGSGVLLVVAVGVANALNALFQVVLARILDPAEYRIVAALFTVVLIAAVPPLAFQATMAREIATRLADGHREEAATALRTTLRAVLLVTVALLVLAAAAIVPVGVLAGWHHGVPIIATAATSAIALAIPVLWGALQGAGRFRELSVAHVSFAGSRFAAGVGAGLAVRNAGAVMVGFAAATALTAAGSVVPLRGLLAAGRTVPGALRTIFTRGNAEAAVGLTVLTALSMDDLLVAAIAFDSDRGGAYASASIGARILLLIAIAVTTVLFPRVATLRDRARERAHLLAGLGAVALLSAAAVAVLWGLADPLIRITFGARYLDAAAWLGPLAVAMAGYSLATVYLYHFLSLGRSRFAVVLVGLLVCQAAAFAALHGSPRELIGVQIVTAFATLAVSEVWHRVSHR